jgi:hypothetical protein
MIRTLLILSIMTTALFSFGASASTATCKGTYKGVKLFFYAKGSLMNKNDGSGLVKINNRVVAQFDGDYARINYLMRTFSIKNNRGDIVEGKLNNLMTGASTLTKMILPGEGVKLYNIAVDCDMN